MARSKDIKKIWKLENDFYHHSDITRIGKLLSQYEIYKKIIELPGDVLEFGVFKGASLIRFLTFRNLLENDYSRRIIGFDTFKEFPKQKRKEDNRFILEYTKDAGKPILKKDLIKILENKNFQNFQLVEGKVEETVKNFLRKNVNLKISLLHLDMDVYNSTKFVLNKLYDKVVKNGIIVIDDYNTVEGATKATDEFIKTKKIENLKKLSFYKVPSFFFKK